MTTRTEVDANIERIIAEWVPEYDDMPWAVVAEKLVARFDESAPDVFEEWLHEHAPAFLAGYLKQLYRKDSDQKSHGTKQKMKDVVDAVSSNGSLDGLDRFTKLHRVDRKGTERPVSMMTGNDHAFVAGCYQRAGTLDAMLAAFHREISKRCGPSRTAEVMSEEAYRKAFDSLVRGRLA